MLDIPVELARYLADRARERSEAERRVLSALSERERRLVREAAVMGFVQGRQDAMAGLTNVPPDSHILSFVIAGCLSDSDLYPTITGYTEEPDSA